MSRLGIPVFLLAGVTIVSAPSFAQSVVSAKSGLVHYIEGDVAVNGEPVSDKLGAFTEVKKGGILETELGRAELLLTPGVFLRVGEHSRVRMVDTHLSDTRVELLAGSMMVESDTPMKDNFVTVLYKGYTAGVRKHGLYEFQTEPAQMKVFAGEAEVGENGTPTLTVKDGRMLAFASGLATERFDAKAGDSLYRWSKNRSEYLSIANVSAARTAQTGGYSSSLLGGGYGGWFYNSSYNMYTYLPYRGTLYSPFGFGFFSPYTVGSFYNPGYGRPSSSSNAASIASATRAATSRGTASSVSSGLASMSSGRGSAPPSAPGGGRR